MEGNRLRLCGSLLQHSLMSGSLSVVTVIELLLVLITSVVSHFGCVSRVCHQFCHSKVIYNTRGSFKLKTRHLLRQRVANLDSKLKDKRILKVVEDEDKGREAHLGLLGVFS